MFPPQIVLIALVTSSTAGYFYIRDTLKGETKPNRISWLIWFVAPVLASAVAFQNGAGLSALPTFMSGFIPFLVLLASFKNQNSYWKLGMLDYACLFLSLCTLISWLLSKEGMLATIFAILADGIAFFPTYFKSWKAPNTETLLPYFSGPFSAILTIATLDNFNFITTAFPLYLIFGNLVEIIIVFYRRKFIKTKNKQ